jgi:serine/threonine protein kinase
MSDHPPVPGSTARGPEELPPTVRDAGDTPAMTPAILADTVTPAVEAPHDAGMTRAFVSSDESNRDAWIPALAGERYEARRLHRQGGLGAVWFAHDRLLGRDVALKTIRPDRIATREALARFIQEARVTGQLEHPSIVPLYDLVASDGLAASAIEGAGPPAGPRYVMRFVTGQTLTEASVDYHRKRAAGQATRMDLAALLDAFIAVCRAVAYAHSRGVLHRDLKGLNVILGGFGEVFLLDWGLAKTGTDDGSHAPIASDVADATGAFTETAAGARVGTPAFMAPEIAAGHPATRQSDVYGLGAILYDLLAGRPPYTGKNAAEILKHLAAGDPAPIHDLNPSAPPALGAICGKAIARDPAQRYASAEELATEVRRWLADEPVAAYREPLPARAARWARRHRTPAIAAGVLLLTAAIASSIAAGLIWREQQQTKYAWQQAESEKNKATENADAAVEVVRNLSKYAESYETGASNVAVSDSQRRDRLDSALASYERLLDLHPDDADVRMNVARMQRYRANLSRFLNETADAERSYREASRHYKVLIAADPGNSAHRESDALTMADYGQHLQRLGRYKDGALLLDNSILTYEELLQAKPDQGNLQRMLGKLLVDRSYLHFQTGQLLEAERAARRSSTLYAGLANSTNTISQPTDAMFRSMAENTLGMALREQGRADDALGVYDAVVERLAGLAKVTAGRDVLYQYHLARAERARTLALVPVRRKAAVAELDAVIDGCEKLAKQFPAVPMYLQSQAAGHTYRGRLKMQLGEREAAGKDLAAARKILEPLVEKYREIPGYRSELGKVYTASGELADDSMRARDWYHKAREMLESAIKLSPENVQYRKALAELDALANDKS